MATKKAYELREASRTAAAKGTTGPGAVMSKSRQLKADIDAVGGRGSKSFQATKDALAKGAGRTAGEIPEFARSTRLTRLARDYARGLISAPAVAEGLALRTAERLAPKAREQMKDRGVEKIAKKAPGTAKAMRISNENRRKGA